MARLGAVGPGGRGWTVGQKQGCGRILFPSYFFPLGNHGGRTMDSTLRERWLLDVGCSPLRLRVFVVKNSTHGGVMLWAASWHSGRVNGIIHLDSGDQSRTGRPVEGNQEWTRMGTNENKQLGRSGVQPSQTQSNPVKPILTS